MKVAAVIPIKINSKRLPNKNITILSNGETLVSRICQTCISCKDIDDVYIFCSTEDVKNFIPKGVKFLKRSAKLDEDNTNATEILDSFCPKVDHDIIVMVHATSPFTQVSTLKTAINSLKNNNYDSVIPVEKIQKFIWFEDTRLNFQKTPVPRTQDVTPILIELANPFVFWRSNFLRDKSRTGDNPMFLEQSWPETIDVDTAKDMEIVNSMLSRI